VSDERYAVESQQRILRVMLALAGHEVTGLAPGELAKGLELPAAQITKDLANLRLAGLAEEIPGIGRWRLTPKLIQIGVALQLAVEQAERKLGEMKQRYTRTPA
jgi:DNA-binding IclR family transcriptional regulator